MKTESHYIALITLLVISFIWVLSVHIRRNNIPKDVQRYAIRNFTQRVKKDRKLEDILKKKSVKLEDVRFDFHHGRYFIHLYLNSQKIDTLSICKRIMEIAKQKDNDQRLGSLISIQFYLGTPDTATQEPFAKKDINLATK